MLEWLRMVVWTVSRSLDTRTGREWLKQLNGQRGGLGEWMKNGEAGELAEGKGNRSLTKKRLEAGDGHIQDDWKENMCCEKGVPPRLSVKVRDLCVFRDVGKRA